MTQRFQVSTRRTGKYRVVKVVVFETQAELWSKITGLYPGDPAAGDALACCHLHLPIEDADPRPHLVTLFLSREHLTGTIIVHEAVHAAMLLYQVDCYRKNARATAHMTPENEPIAYLVADIFAAVVQKLDMHGEPLPTGWGRDYSEHGG